MYMPPGLNTNTHIYREKDKSWAAKVVPHLLQCILLCTYDLKKTGHRDRERVPLRHGQGHMCFNVHNNNQPFHLSQHECAIFTTYWPFQCQNTFSSQPQHNWWHYHYEPKLFTDTHAHTCSTKARALTQSHTRCSHGEKQLSHFCDLSRAHWPEWQGGKERL